MMSALTRAALAASILILTSVFCARPVQAETLIVSVSNHRVTITPNYAGEELVLFGAIERDNKLQPERSDYDVIVTVRGPDVDVVARRKARKLGIWINTESREFQHVPSYLGILSNKPLDAVTTPDMQRRLQLGLDNFPLLQGAGPKATNPAPSDPFRTALIRLRQDKGLYREQTTGVTFLTPRLFRAGISLPEEVATGFYIVEIKLFAAGKLVSTTETAFEIVKVGFEQFVANAARRHGLLYGLATAMMALMTGWLASIAFRRD